MASNIDILRARKILNASPLTVTANATWAPPIAFGIGGEDGWRLQRSSDDGLDRDLLASCSDLRLIGINDGVEWLHVSLYAGEDVTPPYDELVLLHAAFFGAHRYAYQVFAPASQHVNIKNALHLWGRVDGAAVLPEFGLLGSI